MKFVLLNDYILFKFYGENFTELLSEVKPYGVYDQESKAWKIKPYLFETLYNNVHGIEDCTFEPSLQIIKDACKSNVEIEITNDLPNRNLFKYKPIKGKPPYEHFQYDDITKCLQNNRLLIANEMGTGKSYILSMVASHLFNNNKIDHLLIVCPSQMLINWRKELVKFTDIQESDIYIANMDNREPFDDPKNKVVITTYNTLRILYENAYRKATKNNKTKKVSSNYLPLDTWCKEACIILDESHLIKNRKSLQANALHNIKNYFKYRYLASGTPAPNSVADFYSQIKFLSDELMPMNYYQWIATVAALGTKYSRYALRYFHKDKVATFMKKIAPYMIRRFSKDVLELPELMHKKVYCSLDNRQLQIYRKLVELKLTIERDNNSDRGTNISNMFPFICLAIDDPMLLKSKLDDVITRKNAPDLYKLVKNWKFEYHSKIPVLNDLLDEYINEERQKVIVWCHHPLTLDALQVHFSKYKSVVIHGGVEDAERFDLIEKFKNDKNCNILFASQLVLNAGVTINEATRSIYFTRNWSLTDWLQSQFRNYRIGQKNKVIVNPLIFENTLEEGLDSKLTDKEDFNNCFLKLENISKDQLKDMFEGKFKGLF